MATARGIISYVSFVLMLTLNIFIFFGISIYTANMKYKKSNWLIHMYIMVLENYSNVNVFLRDT